MSVTIVWHLTGFQASVPDCMKPDPVAEETAASKSSKKKKKKKKKSKQKSTDSYDADWIPELEEVYHDDHM